MHPETNPKQKGQRPRLPRLGLCPKFFNANNIEGHQELKDRVCTETGDAEHKLGKFMTGGATILHEMTHLHTINEGAGFFEDGVS